MEIARGGEFRVQVREWVSRRVYPFGTAYFCGKGKVNWPGGGTWSMYVWSSHIAEYGSTG